MPRMGPLGHAKSYCHSRHAAAEHGEGASQLDKLQTTFGWSAAPADISVTVSFAAAASHDAATSTGVQGWGCCCAATGK